MSLLDDLERDIPIIAKREGHELSDAQFDLVYDIAEELLADLLDTAIRQAIQRVRKET